MAISLEKSHTWWRHEMDFPRYWPFVRGIHRSPVNSPHKGQWRGALMFSLIWVWINGWVNNRVAGDLRRHRPPLWRHRNESGVWILYMFHYDKNINMKRCDSTAVNWVLNLLWLLSDGVFEQDKSFISESTLQILFVYNHFNIFLTYILKFGVHLRRI